MRRVLSVILFILGGWMLTTEATIAWMGMDMGKGVWPNLVGPAFALLLAAPLLALGTWASPGNRLADLGLTLMIVAGVALFSALSVWLAMNDPQVIKMMPPDQQFPQTKIAPVMGALNLLLIAGGGYALWRKGRGRKRARQAELEGIFGD